MYARTSVHFGSALHFYRSQYLICCTLRNLQNRLLASHPPTFGPLFRPSQPNGIYRWYYVPTDKQLLIFSFSPTTPPKCRPAFAISSPALRSMSNLLLLPSRAPLTLDPRRVTARNIKLSHCRRRWFFLAAILAWLVLAVLRSPQSFWSCISALDGAISDQHISACIKEKPK